MPRRPVMLWSSTELSSGLTVDGYEGNPSNLRFFAGQEVEANGDMVRGRYGSIFEY